MIPHFFIVTPSFNQGKFIKQTIDSVLNQVGDYRLTYWIIDGGSTDQTIDILKSYGSRLNWISRHDHGQVDALNQALKKNSHLQPDYFAFINSDDYYLKDAFAAVHQQFQQHPAADWLVGDAQIVDQTNQLIHRPIRLYKRLFRNQLFKRLIWILNYVPQPSTFFRFQAIKENGLFDSTLQYAFDYDYWLRLIQSTGYPYFYPQTLAAFRIYPHSKSGSQFMAQFDEELFVLNRYHPPALSFQFHDWHNRIIKYVYKLIKS